LPSQRQETAPTISRTEPQALAKQGLAKQADRRGNEEGIMSTTVTSAGELRWYQGIDRKLWIILTVTYVGWLLDSMDLNLFTVVLVPSLRELLGPQATPQLIGYYGGTIAAV
jgi:hypothetical protein